MDMIHTEASFHLITVSGVNIYEYFMIKIWVIGMADIYQGLSDIRGYSTFRENSG